MATLEDYIVSIKQASNTLYALGWNQAVLTDEDRQKMRLLSEQLDEVTKALGGNPMSPAWNIPGNPRRPRPHKNTNLTGCQSRLYWRHGVAAKCCLDEGHRDEHHNGTRSWDDLDAFENATRFGRD